MLTVGEPGQDTLAPRELAALPFEDSNPPRSRPRALRAPPLDPPERARATTVSTIVAAAHSSREEGNSHDPDRHARPGGNVTGATLMASRSEERRVGKECRSRWVPHH